MTRLTVFIALALAAVYPTAQAAPLRAQDDPDPVLMAAILKIWAIDNHAHPLKVVRDGEKPDDEYDALPTDAMQPFDLPVRIRPDNPIYVAAWRELYGYPYHDARPAHLKDMAARKRRKTRERGDGYCAWVLDRLGIEIQLANRVAQGRGLAAQRFRWVPFDDALLFPLDNGAAKRKNSEYDSCMQARSGCCNAICGKPALQRCRRHWTATLRSSSARYLPDNGRRARSRSSSRQPICEDFDFALVSEEQARSVYEQFVRGGEPPSVDYKALQDYLFHYIAREAGRLGLAVHFHTGAGVGAYFDLAGADPLKLEPVFDDPALRKTRFVLLHGGWPFEKSTAFLLSKPNVYADFSYQTFLFTPRQLSLTIKTWLTLVPEKVLFGTDAAAITPEVSWEEVGWLSNRTARRALALALTDLMREHEITPSRALVLARMVLRDNAIRLYGLKPVSML